jgi:surface antigen Omp85-like protein
MMRGIVLSAVAVLACADPAAAQAQAVEEGRAETLKRARVEKQQETKPYEPTMLETMLKRVERSGVPLITRDRVYLKFGSLTTGSGFAYGAGYRRRRLFDGAAIGDVWAGASMTRYWATEARLRFPGLADGHLDVQGYARKHDYPQEDYFGLGPTSRRSNQTDYQLRSTMVGARAALRPVPVVAIGGGLEYIDPRVSNGTDDSLPSIGSVFDETSAPGMSGQPNYVRSIAYVDVDWRRPINARKGGWYRAEWSHYDDRNGMGYSFDRFDVDVRQYVSFLAERRVLVGRVAASTSEVASDQQMPFYLMPTLGGNDSLRGFRDYRFRGPHALLLQAEYRFEIWSGLDAALFTDAGKVALRRSQLNFNNLESDYGFGFRFNTDQGIVVRVDAAFGSRDGKHLWIVFGGTF